MIKPESSSPLKNEKKKSNESSLTDNLNLMVKTKLEMVPPDGGWGWMIILGSVIINILGPFTGFAFSILFSPILIKHETSKTKIAWIYNLRILTLSCYTLFLGPLCQEFGHRKVAFFGGIAAFISMILSTIAPSADFLFFSFGILGGIGGSSSISLSFMILSKYFKKHLGFANGISSIGVCGSSFFAPVVANHLLQNFDYKGSALIFAAIILNQCVGAMLFQPVEWHMKLAKSNKLAVKINECAKPQNAHIEEFQMKLLDNGKVDAPYLLFTEENGRSKFHNHIYKTLTKDNKLADKNNFKRTKLKNILIGVLKSTYKNFKSLKNMRVQFIAWAHCGFLLGFINFFMWIPFVITEEGYSLETAAWCSSLGSIGNISGRIILAVIVDRKFFNVKYGLMLGYFLTGSCIIVFSFVKEIKFYLMTIFIWGVGVGFSGASVATSMIQIMGAEMLPAVLGVSSLLQGFCSITFGIWTGAARDGGKDYTYTLWILAGSSYVAFFLWLCMPLAEKFDKKISGSKRRSK